ncbi:unnamed protein product [Blepharisma stoltei]|uniref:Mitochondrial import inner membrane translocase subunit TIM16 n=1 Tax=Blepharisma stoltei TaxID=1481888 RepID=A0AAU9J9C9_9CILI|nr:unnamed protein product [Blepharisma stoltei]
MWGPILRSLIMTYGVKYAKTFIVATVRALEKSGYQPQKIFEEMLSKTSASKINFQNPMTREEALKILNIKSNPTKAEIEESFSRLYEKNNPEKGGSLYLQCKAMGAKDHLISKKN